MTVLTQALRTQLQQLEAQQQQRSDTAAQPATPDAQPGMAKALAEAEVTIVKRKVHNSSGSPPRMQPLNPLLPITPDAG